MIVEISTEVCFKVGGIHTVIASKAEQMVKEYGNRYILLGPYIPFEYDYTGIFEEHDTLDGLVGTAVSYLKRQGWDVRYGTWLIPGQPQVLLLNPFSIADQLPRLKQDFLRLYEIKVPERMQMAELMLAFGFLVEQVLDALLLATESDLSIVAHFHEFLSAAALPAVRRKYSQVAIVFTTHSTQLGRFLSKSDPAFHENLPSYNWQQQTRRQDVFTRFFIHLERLAISQAHIFTAVSDTLSDECQFLAGRMPDLITPNGINSGQYTQEWAHSSDQEHLLVLEELIRRHFFHHYAFDLNKTLYFFASGRYEYTNKGFDVAIQALAKLNEWMIQTNVPLTVVMLFITSPPAPVMNPGILLRKWYRKLFPSVQRTIPEVFTHQPPRSNEYALTRELARVGLTNAPANPVKVLYHPDFLSVRSPSLPLEYESLVRLCHLGILPSFYEPWGYTAVECVALGTPVIVSDRSGFGQHVQSRMPDHERKGIYVVNRTQATTAECVEELAALLINLVTNASQQPTNRSKQADSLPDLDWAQLLEYYQTAYERAEQAALTTQPEH